MRADLSRLGNNYFQKQLALRRTLERYGDTVGGVEQRRAQELVAESPGDAAMAVVRHTMQSQGIESFEEFREFWHRRELEAEKQRREKRVEARREEGGDNGAS